MRLRCRSRLLPLDGPVVMGVLNVTPDSFSDGGRFLEPAAALAHARQMVADGARIIDVGGESTRPGSVPPSVEEELRRVVPVVRAIAAELDVLISVDTSRAPVIEAAVAAGAGLINDIRALGDPAALEAAVRLGVGVCLMHMQGEPATMQQAPFYGDVVGEVREWLRGRAAAVRAAGIAADAIAVDPGFGFGKSAAQNLALLRSLGSFATLGHPLLVGLSRKALIGQLTGRALDERQAGSVAAAAIAAERGALILRAHDVAETVDAVRVGAALRLPLGEQQ